MAARAHRRRAGMAVRAGASGVTGVGPGLLGAAGLAVVNTGIGVLIHRGSLKVVRVLRHEDACAHAG